MSNRRVSISLLLVLALGFTACGGGGGTPDVEPSGDPVADTTAPVIVNDANITTNPTIEEGSANLTIATIEAEDSSGVTFSLSGTDARYFELTTTEAKNRALVFSTTLKFKDTPDYEEKSSYKVNVNATDSKGNVATKEFIVALEDKPFVFDVSGRMGSVERNGIQTLSLVTKEEKNSVSYSISGSSYFSIDNDSVVFNAPDFNTTIGADNSYSAVVVANDGNSDINLTVSATVVLDSAAPAIKTYLLKSKNVLEWDGKFDYEYVYDENGYLASVDKKQNNVVRKSTTYQYSDDYKVMKGYIDGDLDSIRVFENKNTTSNKFATNINSNRLSVDEHENYMSEIYDTVSYKNNTHLTKYIKNLSENQTLAELYVYNSDDRLRRVLTGNYTIDSEEITSLSDAAYKSSQLAIFPVATEGLSATQLDSLKSGSMPFQVNSETTYIYANSELSGVKGIVYSPNVVEMHDFNASVKYYSNPNKVLHEIDSNINKRVIVTYDNSLLKSVKNDGVLYNYSFYEDGKKMTITVRHDTTAVATYNFEEE